MSGDWPPRVLDPAGREVVFDAGSHLHLFNRIRKPLLDRVDEILGTIASPDFLRTIPRLVASASTARTSRLLVGGYGWS